MKFYWALVLQALLSEKACTFLSELRNFVGQQQFVWESCSMKITRREALGGLSIAALTCAAPSAFGWDGPLMDLVQGTEEFAAASDAYVYGYPLVTMEMTRRVMTNVAEPKGSRGPMGQMIKLRQYPDAKFRDVTAPNADTLYTTSFFDVGDEPWVLSTPDMATVLPAAVPLWLDGRVRGAGQPHDRRRSPDLRNHGTRLVRETSRRHEGTQIADEHRLVARPHLLHRHTGRLFGRACAAGQIQAAAHCHRSIAKCSANMANNEIVRGLRHTAHVSIIKSVFRSNFLVCGAAGRMNKTLVTAGIKFAAGNVIIGVCINSLEVGHIRLG